MDGWFGFVVAGFALAGSPGPNTLSIAAAAAAFGAGRSVGYLTGIVAGMIVVMAVTASGVTGILLALPGAAPVVASLAAAYIVYLAYRIATAPPLAEDAHESRRPSFMGGAFLSLVNPKAYAAMAALFSGFVLVGERPVVDAALKMLILLAIITLVNVAWLFVGSVLTRAFRRPRMNRVINVAFAVLLVASVGFAFLL
jgi:threonine/homoserine/homoserine lactone efflux protein